jgi:hypothetical protein
MKRLRAVVFLVLVGSISSVAWGLASPQTRVETPKLKIDGTGPVTVNGTSAISGATIFSDSTVTTGPKSSAVVSLGKLGRVELKSETTVKLTFTDSNFTLTTGDGQITAGAKKTEVTVDTSCGNTLVAVKKGSLELRAGDSVKQIAAGNQDTAGQARPGCTPSR